MNEYFEYVADKEVNKPFIRFYMDFIHEYKYTSSVSKSSDLASDISIKIYAYNLLSEQPKYNFIHIRCPIIKSSLSLYKCHFSSNLIGVNRYSSLCSHCFCYSRECFTSCFSSRSSLCKMSCFSISIYINWFRFILFIFFSKNVIN
jgi:hypothetical protein